MTTVRLLVELSYDAELMHGSDPESIAWFVEDVLGAPMSGEGCLILHSNEIGDHVGHVRVVDTDIAEAIRRAMISTEDADSVSLPLPTKGPK